VASSGVFSAFAISPATFDTSFDFDYGRRPCFLAVTPPASRSAAEATGFLHRLAPRLPLAVSQDPGDVLRGPTGECPGVDKELRVTPQLYARNINRTDSSQPRLRIQAGGYSVTGTRHRVNQDRLLIDDHRGIYMVADGMGGCRGGERASHMAVELLANHPALVGNENASSETIRHALRQAFLDVSQEILSTANLDAQLYGMGTTAVMTLIVGNRLYIASLGDSRVYLLRDGDLHQYTVDHNMAQTLVNLGVISQVDAREHRWRNMLWKYLGAENLSDGPDVSVVRLEPGDRVVLVTDGTTETLEDRDLVTILDSHPSTLDAAEALVRSAVARGARDDATSVVLDVVVSESTI
jgi:serine/threonine protein phosphatase PrpC